MAIESVNPATGEVLERFEPTAPAAIDRALTAARAAFAEWRRRPFAERGALMRAAASALRGRRTEHARTMALEMGKPVAQGEAEIDKCALTCDHYAEHAEALLAPQAVATEARAS